MVCVYGGTGWFNEWQDDQQHWEFVSKKWFLLTVIELQEVIYK